jgi:hypothetical protein
MIMKTNHTRHSLHRQDVSGIALVTWYGMDAQKVIMGSEKPGPATYTLEPNFSLVI